METGDLSSSLSRDLLAYLRTRFPVWLAVLLPLVLVLAALRERVVRPAESAVALLIALLLVVELRLWDDLCDVESDRHAHADRVLCRSPSLRRFWGLFLLLMAVNFALAALWRGWWSVAMLLGLHVLLAVWYGWRGQAHLGPVVNYHVVLLKYPMIVLMLGAVTAADIVRTPLVLSALMVYLGMCIYEVAHDVRLRQLRSAQICLAVECLLLAVIGCLALLFAGWYCFWP
jgi:4-hydroxybenzoate polyprenyltransferase